jgi:DNA-binding NarL/FixJ family response regulator
MKKIIKVFIVEDHAIFRDGLKMIFNKTNEIEESGRRKAERSLLTFWGKLNLMLF